MLEAKRKKSGPAGALGNVGKGLGSPARIWMLIYPRARYDKSGYEL